jgi:hypothetical protein
VARLRRGRPGHRQRGHPPLGDPGARQSPMSCPAAAIRSGRCARRTPTLSSAPRTPPQALTPPDHAAADLTVVATASCCGVCERSAAESPHGVRHTRTSSSVNRPPPRSPPTGIPQRDPGLADQCRSSAGVSCIFRDCYRIPGRTARPRCHRQAGVFGGGRRRDPARLPGRDAGGGVGPPASGAAGVLRGGAVRRRGDGPAIWWRRRAGSQAGAARRPRCPGMASTGWLAGSSTTGCSRAVACTAGAIPALS